MNENNFDDLVPLIFFLIIVVVNTLKFFIEKGGKAKRTPGKNEGAPPWRAPSSIEEFFEKLAEQVAPQKRNVPAWPESIERPDYIEEMQTFERAQTEDVEERPWAAPAPEPITVFVPEPPKMKVLEKAGRMQAPRQAGLAILSGSQGMRMPGNTFFSTGKAGSIDFQVRGKNNLRQALLGHIVFSPPRACDPSFDDTITKR